MLYDPKWEKPEVKADPFSLESLIAWLETMPGEREYCYLDTGGCLFHQYLTQHGVAVRSMGADYFRLSDRSTQDLPKGWAAIASGHNIFDESRHTFGAALTRAREALASRA